MGKVRDYETSEDTKDWWARALALGPIRQPDEVEYLTLEQYDNLVRVAHWHMRRAGMTPVTPGVVTPLARDSDAKTVFVVGCVLGIVTAAVLTVIRMVA